MRRFVIWLLLMALQSVASAQSPGDPAPAQRHSTEWAVISGGAVDLPGGAHGGEFWAVQLRWGKVLTAPHGPGALRGTLEYAFELVPVMLLRQAHITSLSFPSVGVAFPSPPSQPPLFYNPTAIAITSSQRSESGALYGAGINPFFWQYNFTSHPRVVPYIQFGGGVLFTTRDFPVGASSFNYTPQAGLGAYWFPRPRRAVNFGVRYHHISNAGSGGNNPGANALYFYGGLSWWR